MKSIIGENIKEIIEKKGYKQIAVARMAGYKASIFNNLLNGRKIITDDDIIKISKCLEVTPNVLFGIKDKNNKAS